MTDKFVTPLTLTNLNVLLQESFIAGFKPDELTAVDALFTNFMQQYLVPGMSVAITQGGRLVYAQGFGVAQKWNPAIAIFQTPEPVTVWHRFRIASLSKPITSVAIFKLIDQQQLALDRPVFGAGGALGTNFGFDSLPAEQADLLAQITVQHLLEHTSGGWSNDNRDPMFIMPELNQQELITWVLRNRPLDHVSGTVWSYSNFGYCLLGRVIEQVSGQPYADFVRKEVLAGCGITTMDIAGDTLAEKKPREVVYYGQPFFQKVSAGGATVGLKFEDDPYAIPVSRMDSHGGWIASAVDLVRFASRIDSLLTPASLKTMTTPTTVRKLEGEDANYGKGWVIADYRIGPQHGPFSVQHNWAHDGSLPGTTSLLVRSSNGFCWAALINTRQATTTQNLSVPFCTTMPSDLDLCTMWRLWAGPPVYNSVFNGPVGTGVGLVSQWPTDDRFYYYDDPVSGVRPGAVAFF